MKVTIAKALKMKNRLVKKIRKCSDDIATYNQRPAGAEPQFDVRQAAEDRAEAIEKLLAVKLAVIEANGPVWFKILQMSELKGQIKSWQEVPHQHGKRFDKGSYLASSQVVEYAAEFQKAEIDKTIQLLEKMIDDIQDTLDTFNATTEIEIPNM